MDRSQVLLGSLGGAVNFKGQFSKFLSILCLIVYGWILLATSSLSTLGSFYISSDCVSPIRQKEAISVSSGEITAPSGTTFLDYGLPTTTLTVELGSTGVFNGRIRNCQISYGSDNGLDEEVQIFSCFDDRAFACTVIIEDQF